MTALVNLAAQINEARQLAMGIAPAKEVVG